ncbi:MAG: PAS domain-containing protein, partial [Nitrospirota bacterium]|nr:PAS domain-containing protein [Nitrospirota bacterium]
MHLFSAQTKDILDTIADGIVVIGSDYKIAFVNKAMLDLCGLKEERAIVGKECYDFAHRCSVPCYQQNSPDELTCPYHEGFAEGKSVSVTHCHRMPDGSDKTYQITASPVKDEQDSVTHIIEVYRDISWQIRKEDELRGSEARYRSVVDHIGVGISLISPDMKIISLNSQMKTWFPDIDVSAHPVCYKAFRKPPQNRVCSYCPTIRTLRDGEVHEVVSETPANGEIRHYKIISTPLKDKDGRVIAAIEMVDDITEITKTVESLREREAFIENILETVDEGFIVIDHDY